jgi:Family of unknown function (DUF5989)
VKRLEIINEYFRFLGEQKKWWMFPVILVVMLLGLLLLFAQGSPLAPFIYTIF